MTKRIAIMSKPTPSNVESWVEDRQLPPNRRPTRRLTLDVDAELHRRMRLACVQQGLVMADEIRRLIEERFSSGS